MAAPSSERASAPAYPFSAEWRNIKRIDTGHTHGWQVVIQRQGEEHSKLFSDKKCGGRDKALAAARRHRARLLRRLPPLPDTYSAEHLHVPEIRERAWQKRTSTGVKGIGFTWQYSNGTAYPHVQVMWTDPDGTPRSRSRSISAHGLKAALHECCHLLYEGRRRCGPSPEALYEQALPALHARLAAGEG